MRPICTSPLESLAAFAITFISGVATAVSLRRYIDRIRRSAQDVAR